MHSNCEETPKHTPRNNDFNVRHKSTLMYQNRVWSIQHLSLCSQSVHMMAPFELTF